MNITIIKGLHINFHKHVYDIMTLKPYSWRVTKHAKNLKALKPGNFAKVVDKKGKRKNYVFIINVLKNVDRDKSVNGVPAYKLARVISIRDNMPDIRNAQTAYIKYLKMEEAHKLPANAVKRGRFSLSKNPKFLIHKVHQHNPHRVRNIIQHTVSALGIHGTYSVKRHKRGFYIECEDGPKTDEDKAKVRTILQKAVEDLNCTHRSHYAVQPRTSKGHRYYVIAPKGNK